MVQKMDFGVLEMDTFLNKTAHLGVPEMGTFLVPRNGNLLTNFKLRGPFLGTKNVPFLGTQNVLFFQKCIHFSDPKIFPIMEPKNVPNFGCATHFRARQWKLASTANTPRNLHDKLAPTDMSILQRVYHCYIYIMLTSAS